MTRKWQVSRRTMLKGLGAAIALPGMEAMSAPTTFGASSIASTTATQNPTRMAYLFVPNGVHVPDWTPEQDGFGYDLPYILEPLQRVKNKVNVLTGLTHDKGRANGDGPGDHARSASVFLTGSQPRKTNGENIRVGISVDQVAAQQIGHKTRFASLELGTERGQNAGNCDSGYSCAYSSNISWSSPSTPVGKEVNPRLVFERLFANKSSAEVDRSQQMREELKLSILDFVQEDAKQLQNRLGRNDQRKLDEYMTGIRQIEQRLTRIESDPDQIKVIQNTQMPERVPDDYQEHIRLMCDMLVLAFQTDSTRIATFMVANAGSNRSYRPIGVSNGHHALSHHGGDAKKHDMIRRINRFHVTQLAYLLEKLDSIKEGDQTLLDSCMLMYGSGLSDGNRHNNENLPILLAGGGNGSIRTGQHIRYTRETPMTNLYLSMLDRVGAPVDYLGDSTGRLPRLDG